MGDASGIVAPITDFRVKGFVAATVVDLERFDVAALGVNLTSAMYLLYIDSTGARVSKPVTVNAVTGALTVPLS